jgi:predicted DNA-binding protein (MmcQ/YjbR family)
MHIEQLRKFCLSLPHATEDVKWEKDLCFCIGEKMFCVTGLEDGHDSASVKVSNEEFDEMTSREGIEPAPYLARYKWVLAKFSALSDAEWQHYIHQSYELVKAKLPAKIRAGLQ